MTLSSLAPKSFPLPDLTAKIDAIRFELKEGSGMVSVLGVSPQRYSELELKILWYGLCVNLGTPIYQNHSKQLLRKIRNEGRDVGIRYGQLESANGVFLSSRARTASSRELRFHTDRTDVVGLLCLGKARRGGETRIASSVTIHNEMLRRRPDLARLLYQPVYRSRLGEEKGGDTLYYALPVFACRGGKFTSHYSRTYVEAAQLLPEVPRMTDEQWEALDLLAELAEEVCFETTFEPGDIQFLNSHVTYHARRPFEDDRRLGLQRNLLRIWLCPPGNRPLPLNHAVLWGTVEADSLRGGIAQTS